MKKVLAKTSTILVYIVALLWLVEFRIWLLFDIKLILMVIFGTAMLTLSCYKRNTKLKELKIPASWNAQVTGYLTTFVLMFSRLSGNQDYHNLMYDIALNCRPLFYGFLINVLLKSDEANQIQEEKVSVDKSGITIDTNSIKQKLRNLDATEREAEISIYIIDGYSNKEIATELYISEGTVKKHTANLYKKLGINNREQLKQLFIK